MIKTGFPLYSTLISILRIFGANAKVHGFFPAKE